MTKIENGDVFQDKKRPTRRLVVVNAEPDPNGQIELKNEGTEVRNFIKPEGLDLKFRFVGRFVAQPGTDELVFVEAERIGSGPVIEAERTENPPDPSIDEQHGDLEEVTGQGIIAQAEEDAAQGAGSEEDRSVAGGLERFQFTNAIPDTDDLIRVIAMVMRGELRTIDVEFKNKEMRLFCPEQERGSIVAAPTFKELLEESAQELLLRWRHVSPMPKPGGSEIPVKSHLAPRGGVLADTAAATGDKQPEAQA